MNESKLLEYYEKLHFHEIELRDKIAGRIQIPIVLILALIGFIAHMIVDVKMVQKTPEFIVFALLFAACVLQIIIAIALIVKSWRAYDVAVLPTAESVENYRKQLAALYSDYSNSKLLVNQYMTDFIRTSYIKCASVNSTNNEIRVRKLHRGTGFIISAAVFAFLAFIPFHLGELNNSNESNKESGSNTNSVEETTYV